ncbi:MAG: hypothetical protein NT001_02800 [Candidatus Woesearchaeota archaeon]|nr:hypothetical protein [Candidatus Woesearchaeota archaeon]
MKKNKKAFMSTLEAVIAVITGFLFVSFIISSRSPTGTFKENIDLMSILKDNPGFRQCALSSNLSCLNDALALHYPDFVKVYNYEFNVTTSPRSAPPDMPAKDIYLESVFITGNSTFSYPRVVRLYYWTK